MSKLPSTSPKLIGRALIIGNRLGSGETRALSELQLRIESATDPYAAMAEIAARPLVYRALILPMLQIFPEELALVRAVKKRYPHVQIIAAQVGGRLGRAEELHRLGVDAIVSEKGLQYFSPAPKSDSSPVPAPAPQSENTTPVPFSSGPVSSPEPVLTAEELRALLGESSPPVRGVEHL